jgi:hypothetical protein
MADVEDCGKPLMGVEQGNLPDAVAEPVRFVLGEQVKTEERLKTSESATGMASTKAESLEETMIEAAFSQGGRI